MRGTKAKQLRNQMAEDEDFLAWCERLNLRPKARRYLRWLLRKAGG